MADSKYANLGTGSSFKSDEESRKRFFAGEAGDYKQEVRPIDNPTAAKLLVYTAVSGAVPFAHQAAAYLRTFTHGGSYAENLAKYEELDRKAKGAFQEATMAVQSISALTSLPSLAKTLTTKAGATAVEKVAGEAASAAKQSEAAIAVRGTEVSGEGLGVATTREAAPLPANANLVGTPKAPPIEGLRDMSRFAGRDAEEVLHTEMWGAEAAGPSAWEGKGAGGMNGETGEEMLRRAEAWRAAEARAAGGAKAAESEHVWVPTAEALAKEHARQEAAGIWNTWEAVDNQMRARILADTDGKLFKRMSTFRAFISDLAGHFTGKVPLFTRFRPGYFNDEYEQLGINHLSGSLPAMLKKGAEGFEAEMVRFKEVYQQAKQTMDGEVAAGRLTADQAQKKMVDDLTKWKIEAVQRGKTVRNGIEEKEDWLDKGYNNLYGRGVDPKGASAMDRRVYGLMAKHITNSALWDKRVVGNDYPILLARWSPLLKRTKTLPSWQKLITNPAIEQKYTPLGEKFTENPKLVESPFLTATEIPYITEVVPNVGNRYRHVVTGEVLTADSKYFPDSAMSNPRNAQLYTLLGGGAKEAGANSKSPLTLPVVGNIGAPIDWLNGWIDLVVPFGPAGVIRGAAKTAVVGSVALSLPYAGRAATSIHAFGDSLGARLAAVPLEYPTDWKDDGVFGRSWHVATNPVTAFGVFANRTLASENQVYLNARWSSLPVKVANRERLILKREQEGGEAIVTPSPAKPIIAPPPAKESTASSLEKSNRCYGNLKSNPTFKDFKDEDLRANCKKHYGIEPTL